MSRIMFRQKTPEEMQADGVGKEHPSAAPPPGAGQPAADPAPDFALDGAAEGPKSTKGRRKLPG